MSELPSLLTVQQFLEKHRAFTNGGIRDKIFYRKTNGLDDYKVIIKHGRRILIDEHKFFEWLQR